MHTASNNQQNKKGSNFDVDTDLLSTHHHHHHHLSLNCEGWWGTTEDLTKSFLHFSLFSTALWDLLMLYAAQQKVKTAWQMKNILPLLCFSHSVEVLRGKTPMYVQQFCGQ